MKYFILFLLTLLFSCQFIAQQQLLVTPENDAIPLYKGVNPSHIISEMSKDYFGIDELICSGSAIFGYPPDVYPSTINLFGNHNDIMGMWFVAPATGRIDTIFWSAGSYSGTPDNLVYLQIHRSRIGHNSGPGINFPNACLNWGYYLNTNDLDQGIAAFPEDATGDWISTVDPPYESYPPAGELIWGGTPGAPLNHISGINKFALSDWSEALEVNEGDSFFISMRVTPLYHYIGNDNKGFLTSPTAPLNRVWKFYEHARPGCNGPTTNGWFVREFGVFNWWYSMTVSVNVAPQIGTVTALRNTFSTNQQVVEAELLDCDFENPSEAEIDSALIKWTGSGVNKPDIVMSHMSGNIYGGEIPNTPGKISYSIYVKDIKGLSYQSPQQIFSIARPKNKWYVLDLESGHDEKNISVTGISIPPSSFFNPQQPSYSADDGTAGPFEIGGPMVFNGDTVRYAWVGVNGAIALTASVLDTQDVNGSGLYSAEWTFPNGLQHNGRGDVEDSAGIPKNLISAFGSDLLLNDGLNTYGKIMYQENLNEDTCIFVVEWDSIGYYDYDMGSGAADITTFRIILNRCTGSIEFQYKSVGTTGLDAASLVGIEKDSSGIYPGDWLFVNKSGYPVETKPKDNWSIKFVNDTNSVIVSNTAAVGWNMISVPIEVVNLSTVSVYPQAVSSAFTFDESYIADDNLKYGSGYWLKFLGGEVIEFEGPPMDEAIINVHERWNIVGSVSMPIATSTIISNPPGIVTSPFYKYNLSTGQYEQTTMIEPGLAYWVKVDQQGQLVFSSNGAYSATERIKIVLTDELPPPPPENPASDSKSLPKEFRLEQNNPNPFNPVTVIRYQLPVDVKVTLKIYNTLGQEVATLVEGIQEAGYKSVEFNANSLPSGVYMYRLTAGRFEDVKKMMIVK